MTTAPVDIKIKALDRFSSVFKKGERGLGKISGAARRVSNNFQTLARKTAGFRKSMSRANKTLSSTGKAMSIGVSLPVIGIGADIIRTAARFEKSMNKVKALTGETGEGFTEMRNLAKQLGESTVFSASEAADAMSFLGMAGWETNQILKATPALLDLAASSNTDLARTADIASNIMGAFQIEAAGAGRVADLLAAVTSSANVDMEMLAESMKFMGPVAKDFGMSLEEAGAAAGLLGNIGIQGTMAGTAMRRMMGILTAPTKEAAGALDSLGVNVADSKGNIRSFNDIMIDLGDGLGKLPQKEKLEKLNKVFGLLGISAASNLEKVVETGEFEKYTNSLKDVEGRASSMAKTMNSGAAGAMKNFESAMEGLKIAISDSGFLKAFTDVTKSITGFIRTLSKENPETLKFGAFAAIGLAVLGPIALAITAIGSALLPIAGLVAAAVVAFATMDEPLNLVKYAMFEIKNLGEFFTKEITRIPHKLSALFEGTSQIINGYIDRITKKVASIKSAVGGFFGKVFGSDDIDVNANRNVQTTVTALSGGERERRVAPIRSLVPSDPGETNTLNVKFENPPPGIQVSPSRARRTKINIDAGLQAAGGL